ncbi:uncharacterized protein Dwil_GK25393 [Drosophila willistoni]|uniref:DUF4794 domain-containing protein n=1 Tax=Drosophila willistoni TaxID=7260 RepID=B4NDW8_DROWI|nr:uncharacterized protein LOC6648861 [Drosophila willistoni]EDW81937.2 uncharacterized protein Dwil_GK25393 [Drosophila willistoni]
MAIKLFALLAIGMAMLVAVSDARHVPGHRVHRYHPNQQSQRALIAKPHAAQTRVFPGAVAIKKLVLLKFKKIVPISLILLKSSNDNEAELVPVYPTDQIPENVQFIPTPNGISGHKDVQAIAIPSELHDQLQINGLSNLENIEALLQSSSISGADNESAVEGAEGPVVLGNSIAVAQPEDQPLEQPENDEDQLLDGTPVATPAVAAAPALRRLSADELLRSGVRNSAKQQQTSVEEIPLLLYSATDGGSISPAAVASGSQGRRYVAATPARRRHQSFY